MDHFGSFKTFESVLINCIKRYGLELLLRCVFLVIWHSLSVFFYLNILTVKVGSHLRLFTQQKNWELWRLKKRSKKKKNKGKQICSSEEGTQSSIVFGTGTRASALV